MVHPRLPLHASGVSRFGFVAVDLAILPPLAGARGNLNTVLPAPFDGATPVLDINHPFRSVLRTVARAAFHKAKVGVFFAALGRARLSITSVVHFDDNRETDNRSAEPGDGGRRARKVGAG